MGRKIAGYNMVAIPCQYGVFSSFIYIRKHISKTNANGEESELALDRTAYVVNLPRKITSDGLKMLLENVGPIQLIIMGEKSEGQIASSAHVVFKSSSSLLKALKISSIETKNDTIVENALEGMHNDNTLHSRASTHITLFLSTNYLAAKQRYYDERPGIQVLKAEADEYMANFDAEEEAVCLLNFQI